LVVFMDEHPSSEKILDLKTASLYLRLSTSHVRNILAGRVPGLPMLKHARVGRRIVFKQVWLNEWLEEVGETCSR